MFKLLVDLDRACDEYQDKALRELNCEHVQRNEAWSFVGAKEKNTPQEPRGEHGTGDVWTWTALDPDSKLMVSWYIGKREPESAYEFLSDGCGSLNQSSATNHRRLQALFKRRS